MLSGTYRREARGNGAILVFDEELVILDLLTAILRREGYQVTTTGSWEEAIRLVTSRSYDLAIADLELRRMDGWRLVTTLRDVSPETPILAMTAYPAEEVVTFAEQHVEALIAKPFGIVELVEAVRGVLDGRVTTHTRPMTALTPRRQSAQMLAASG